MSRKASRKLHRFNVTLQGIDEDLTFEEAIQILDLLRQQQQRQITPGGSSGGPDY